MKPLLSKKFVCLTATMLLATAASAEFQRDYVSMVGSTEVFPYAKAVGDKATQGRHIHAPLVQALGTGGGIKLFCEGMGPTAPDIALASRPMKESEKKECDRNGIDVLELKIGYDAVIVAQSKKAAPWSLSSKELRLAMAKWLVDSDNRMAPNPNRFWKDINESLPKDPIVLLGPPTTSTTYGVLTDMISEKLCDSAPWLPEGENPPAAEAVRKCHRVREDRSYQEGRANDMKHVMLIANSTQNEVGLVGYKLSRENADQIRAIPIDGVSPTYENIATGAYSGARPLYFYVKTAKIRSTPGMREILSEISADRAWGDHGYLHDMGMIAMTRSERDRFADKLAALGIEPGAAITHPDQGRSQANKKGKKRAKKH